MRLLQEGGNAVDAAIAATAAQGVVAPETCGIGGDLFALVHRKGWAVPRAINASGRAGAGARADLLRDSGRSVIPADHPLAVTAPGCVDGWAALSEELGRLRLGDSLRPAIELAAGGFEASVEQANAFEADAPLYSMHPAVSEFYPGGIPVRPGDLVTRSALAATIDSIAREGRDYFYRGDPADDIVQELEGAITHDDLALIHAEWVEPLSIDIGGYTAWTVPPNSQGYLGLAALAVLEMLGPPAPDDPGWWHLSIEAFRCVAWERGDLVADPDHAPLPDRLLLDRERLSRAAATVDRHRTGTWPKMMEAGGTAYMCVVDDEGTAVSIIQSNYRGIGSAFGAPRCGFILHNRGSGFTLTAGHPNEIAPGKRPMHTLSPTLWTLDSDTSWLIGTRGGSLQPQLVAQIGARAVLAGLSLTETQQAPRWVVEDHGPFTEPRLQVEPGIPKSIIDDLRGKGHLIAEMSSPRPDWGPVSIISIERDQLTTHADPRVDTTSSVVF